MLGNIRVEDLIRHRIKRFLCSKNVYEYFVANMRHILTEEKRIVDWHHRCFLIFVFRSEKSPTFTIPCISKNKTQWQKASPTSRMNETCHPKKPDFRWLNIQGNPKNKCFWNQSRPYANVFVTDTDLWSIDRQISGNTYRIKREIPSIRMKNKSLRSLKIEGIHNRARARSKWGNKLRI